MIERIRRAMLASKRRKEVEAQFDAAHTEIQTLRPRKIFRMRDWAREVDALDATLRWLVRAKTLDEVEKQSAAITQIIERSRQLIAMEAQIAATIETAEKKADALRMRAATLPGSTFQQEVARKRQTIKDECSHIRRVRDARTEAASLKNIEDKLASLEGAIVRAEQVTATMPFVETQIANLKPEDISLDVGTSETYEDILATFGETQKDIKRGDYEKATQRLRELESLQHQLTDRLGRRAKWAIEEVRMWLATPSVAEAFPQLAQFPVASMSPSNIESLYGLRADIDRIVKERAAAQRERNTPERDVATGRKLAASHPLRMRFEESVDANELDEFLRCVTAFGKQS